MALTEESRAVPATVAASSHIDEDDGEQKALFAELLCAFLPPLVTQAILGLGVPAEAN